MNSEVVLFDSNVLPVSGSLESPFWLSVERLCQASGITACLPAIVVHECVNIRRNQFAAAAGKFVSAFKGISRYFDAEPVYVPDVDEICRRWEEELRTQFEVLDTHGEDAIEALRREALRYTPASKGTGARDSAIWLTALRLATSGSKVTLVSMNTNDFALGKPSQLHPVLAAEAADLAGSVVYYASMDDFIDRIASPSDAPNLDTPQLVITVGLELRDATFAASAEDERFGELSAEQLGAADLIILEVRSLRAYAIGTDGLALVDGRGRFAWSDREAAGLDELGFHFRAWLDFDLQSKIPVSGEIYSLQIDNTEPAGSVS